MRNRPHGLDAVMTDQAALYWLVIVVALFAIACGFMCVRQ
jgi:hypothetical protein